MDRTRIRVTWSKGLEPRYGAARGGAGSRFSFFFGRAGNCREAREIRVEMSVEPYGGGEPLSGCAVRRRQGFRFGSVHKIGVYVFWREMDTTRVWTTQTERRAKNDESFSQG